MGVGSLLSSRGRLCQAVRPGSQHLYLLSLPATSSIQVGFNWLLCNVIQTTSLHDILWHFVAALTPSPIEAEEDEDEDNKSSKENAEQVGFLLLFRAFPF